MNGYPYPSRPFRGGSNGSSMMNMAPEGINRFDGVEGQSLDSIVTQNDKENRRRSMPVYRGASQMGMSRPDAGRMMSFGEPNNGGNMDEFQFDMSNAAMDGMMRNNTAFPQTTGDMQNDRLPTADLAISTRFQGQNSPFSTMAAPGSAYASPMHQKGSLDMDISYSNGMNMSMDMDDSLGMMPTDMNLFSTNQFNAPMLDSPINQDMVGPLPAPSQDNHLSSMQCPEQFNNESMSNTPEARSGGPGFLSRTGSQDQHSMRSISRPQSEQHSSTSVPTRLSLASLEHQKPIAQDPAVDMSEETIKKKLNNSNLPFSTPSGGFPSTMHANPHMKTQFKNAYSATGFDMLGVLVCLSIHSQEAT